MNLRARVLAGIALIALVLGGVGLVITRTTRSDMVQQIDDQLASAIGTVGKQDQRPDHGALPSTPGADPPPDLSTLYVGHVEGDGVVADVTPDLRGEDRALPDISASEAVAAANSHEPFTVASTDGELDYRVLAFHQPDSDIVKVIALSLDSVDDTITSLITVEALGGLLILATLGLVAWWVIHLGVRPLKEMTSAATTIADGDLSHRVPQADPRTEAGELGAALNRMLGQIESAFDERTQSEERLRQFVADASHELRTPVATIRGYAELYRTGGLADRTGLDDAMRRTEQESIRMATLVDDLLVLARLDQSRPLATDDLDLSVLAEDAAHDARAIDPQRPVTAVTDGPVPVVGDEPRLRQVVANLVANALLHTTSPTPVEIRAFRDGPTAVLEVSDHGPGMTEEVAARVFERFYRADPSRSRHRGGSGLGLSIVAATIEAHGGTATISTAPNEGTTVRVELPAAP
jgi:two-component system OmpR family sensor kinase